MVLPLQVQEGEVVEVAEHPLGQGVEEEGEGHFPHLLLLEEVEARELLQLELWVFVSTGENRMRTNWLNLLIS